MFPKDRRAVTCSTYHPDNGSSPLLTLLVEMTTLKVGQPHHTPTDSTEVQKRLTMAWHLV